MAEIKVPYSYLKTQFDPEKIEKIVAAVRRVAKRGDFTLGKEVWLFEEKLADLFRAKHAVALNSGTAALIGILEALKIGRGDEVITVPNSFYATAASIHKVGARIVFVDVNAEYLIDPDKIEDAITEKTRAIMPVHLTGCPADMFKISDIAKRHGLYVVEDAAQSICSEIGGRRFLGTAAAVSFHPLKNLNSWDNGGAVITNDDAIAHWLKKWSNHGMESRDECAFLAVNERMHTMTAAVLLEIFDEVESITEQRIKNAALYDELLKSMAPFVILPRRLASKRQVYHTYVVRIPINYPWSRDNLREYLLKEKGVETKVHYPIPMHLQKAMKRAGYNFRFGDFPNCERQAEEILTLPIHQYLTEKQIVYVAESIADFINKTR